MRFLTQVSSFAIALTLISCHQEPTGSVSAVSDPAPKVLEYYAGDVTRWMAIFIDSAGQQYGMDIDCPSAQKASALLNTNSLMRGDLAEYIEKEKVIVLSDASAGVEKPRLSCSEQKGARPFQGFVQDDLQAYWIEYQPGKLLSFPARCVGLRRGFDVARFFVGQSSETILRPASELADYAVVPLDCGNVTTPVSPGPWRLVYTISGLYLSYGDATTGKSFYITTIDDVPSDDIAFEMEWIDAGFWNGEPLVIKDDDSPARKALVRLLNKIGSNLSLAILADNLPEAVPDLSLGICTANCSQPGQAPVQLYKWEPVNNMEARIKRDFKGEPSAFWQYGEKTSQTLKFEECASDSAYDLFGLKTNRQDLQTQAQGQAWVESLVASRQASAKGSIIPCLKRSQTICTKDLPAAVKKTSQLLAEYKSYLTVKECVSPQDVEVLQLRINSDLTIDKPLIISSASLAGVVPAKFRELQLIGTNSRSRLVHAIDCLSTTMTQFCVAGKTTGQQAIRVTGAAGLLVKDLPLSVSLAVATTQAKYPYSAYGAENGAIVRLENATIGDAGAPFFSRGLEVNRSYAYVYNTSVQAQRLPVEAINGHVSLIADTGQVVRLKTVDTEGKPMPQNFESLLSLGGTSSTGYLAGMELLGARPLNLAGKAWLRADDSSFIARPFNGGQLTTLVRDTSGTVFATLNNPDIQGFHYLADLQMVGSSMLRVNLAKTFRLESCGYDSMQNLIAFDPSMHIGGLKPLPQTDIAVLTRGDNKCEL